MPDQKDKDEQVTTPLEDAQRITPFGTPPPSGGTPSPDLPDASLRLLRQRYDILAEVGRGGMGIVYRARDRETGDVVALKVLRPEIAARPEVIERFKSELLLARASGVGSQRRTKFSPHLRKGREWLCIFKRGEEPQTSGTRLGYRRAPQ